MNGGRQSSALLPPLLVVWVVHLIKKSTRAVSRTSCHITNTPCHITNTSSDAPAHKCSVAQRPARRQGQGCSSATEWEERPGCSTERRCCFRCRSSGSFCEAHRRWAASSDLCIGARRRLRAGAGPVRDRHAHRRNSAPVHDREKSTKIPSPRMDPAEFPTDPHRRD